MAPTLLSPATAAAIDAELFNDYQFSVDQLMELAGQGCAHALAEKYPVGEFPRVLVVCGPGNNGGDGMVCARHLVLMGYRPSLVWVKPSDTPLYNRLMVQCRRGDVAVLGELPELAEVDSAYDLAVDAVFGFSFRPPVRPALLPVVDWLAKTSLPVLSIDVPSGWDVANGPPAGPHVTPDTLVSLTAPKLCAQHFKGRHHVLAGRFVPPELAQKHGLSLPEYEGLKLTVDL